MAVSLILSGGTGARLDSDTPKQYIMVGEKPVIGYCLDVFQLNRGTSGIIIVADHSWRKMISDYIRDHGITKFVGFADAGTSRQHSILNGLRCIKAHGFGDEECVVIHDAARPCVTDKIISDCIDTLKYYDCSMPVIAVKDTVYLSDNGGSISQLLNRDKLFAGQAPEGCHLGTYLSINEKMTNEELRMVRGTSAVAYENGLTVRMFPGAESNYKITTKEDLNKFKLEMEKINESI